MSDKVPLSIPSVDNLKFSVYVVGNSAAVKAMFRNDGHTVVNSLRDDPDVVVFTGGEDISPWLYGERPHKKTGFSMLRDMEEIKVWQQIKFETPKVGICRGGQLLNVLSGGSMWQHVDAHALGGMSTHAIETWDGDELQVNSTHHQMMRPHSDAMVLAWSNIATSKETDCIKFTRGNPSFEKKDVEAVFYHNTNAFCFQPHPEYKHLPTKRLFYKFIHEMYAREIVNKQHRKSLN